MTALISPLYESFSIDLAPAHLQWKLSFCQVPLHVLSLSLSLCQFLPPPPPPPPPIIIAWPLCLPHDEFLMSCCYFPPIILMDSNSLSTIKSVSHPLFTFIKATPVRFRLTCETSRKMVPYRIKEQTVQ